MPWLLIEQPGNVAMPFTVLAVLPPVHANVPADGFVPIASEMVPTMPLVTTLPPASVMPTWMLAGNGAPAAAVAGGWTMKVSLDAGPATTLNAALVAGVRAGVDVAVS